MLLEGLSEMSPIKAPGKVQRRTQARHSVVSA